MPSQEYGMALERRYYNSKFVLTVGIAEDYLECLTERDDNGVATQHALRNRRVFVNRVVFRSRGDLR